MEGKKWPRHNGLPQHSTLSTFLRRKGLGPEVPKVQCLAHRRDSVNVCFHNQKSYCRSTVLLIWLLFFKLHIFSIKQTHVSKALCNFLLTVCSYFLSLVLHYQISWGNSVLIQISKILSIKSAFYGLWSSILQAEKSIFFPTLQVEQKISSFPFLSDPNLSWDMMENPTWNFRLEMLGIYENKTIQWNLNYLESSRNKYSKMAEFLWTLQCHYFLW